MLIRVAVFVVALAVYSNGGPIKVPPFEPLVDYGNANLIVDGILFSVNRNLPNYFAIPDIGGTYDLTNCFFKYEHGIRRDGDATMIVDGQNVRFNSAFKMQNIRIDCTWHYLGMDGGAAGMTDIVSIDSGMYLLLQQGQHPWLTAFQTTAIGTITSDVNGLGLLDWLAEDIANMVLNNLEDEISLIIETMGKDAFQEALNLLVIP